MSLNPQEIIQKRMGAGKMGGMRGLKKAMGKGGIKGMLARSSMSASISVCAKV